MKITIWVLFDENGKYVEASRTKESAVVYRREFLNGDCPSIHQPIVRITANIKVPAQIKIRKQKLLSRCRSLQKKLAAGLPSQADMESLSDVAVDRVVEWTKKNKRNVSEWKDAMWKLGRKTNIENIRKKL